MKLDGGKKCKKFCGRGGASWHILDSASFNPRLQREGAPCPFWSLVDFGSVYTVNVDICTYRATESRAGTLRNHDIEGTGWDSRPAVNPACELEVEIKLNCLPADEATVEDFVEAMTSRGLIARVKWLPLNHLYDSIPSSFEVSRHLEILQSEKSTRNSFYSLWAPIVFLLFLPCKWHFWLDWPVSYPGPAARSSR